MQALGVLSAVTQKRCQIVGRAGRSMTGLYIMVSAVTGDGKSRSQEEVARPVRDAQTRQMEDAKRQAVPLETRRRILRRQASRLEGMVVRSVDEVEREHLESQVNNIHETLAQIVFPQGRLFTGDTSMERLLEMMAHNGQHMFFLSGEGSRLLEMMTYYQPLLDAYNNKPLDQSRMSRSDVILPEPSLAILLAVQPTILSGLVATKEYLERGLLGRFLYLTDSPEPPDFQPSVAVDQDLYDSYESRVLQLLSNPVKHGLRRRTGPTAFELNGSTQRMWQEFDLDARRRSSRGDLQPIESWGVRMGENALKIACVLHALQHPDFDRAPGDISDETMSHAIELMNYLVPQARRAFSAEVLHFGEVAQKLFNWFSKSRDVRRDGGFLYEQVLRAFGGRHNTVEVRAGINALISGGYITRVSGEGNVAERFRVTRWH